MRLRVEDFIRDTLESPHDEYLHYKLTAVKALLLPRKVWDVRIGQLFKFDHHSSKPFNPFPQLDDFFEYMNKIESLQPYFRIIVPRLSARRQEPIVDQYHRGTTEDLGVEEVLAIYGRLYSIYDATTGCSPAAVIRRVFSPEAELRRSLPEIGDIVDYIKQRGLEDRVT